MSRTFLYRPAFCSSLRSGCHRHGRAYGVDAGAVARTVDVGAAVGDVVPVGDVDAVGEGVGEGVWLTGTLGLGVAATVGLGDGADGLAGTVAGRRSGRVSVHVRVARLRARRAPTARRS